MDGINTNDFRIQSSDHERGHVMEKLIYWLKKTIKRDKQCRHFCTLCTYYGTCKSDE